MFVVAITKSAWHAVGERIASFLIAVYHTCSERGQVKLASRDWREEPVVEFNLLSDRRDLERLMQAFRMLGKLYMTPAMQAVTSDPFPATYSDRVRKVGVVNAKNKVHHRHRRRAARRAGRAAELHDPQLHHRGFHLRRR